MTEYRAQVGEPSKEAHTCGFALERSSPTCGAPAVVHLVVSYGPGDSQLAMLSACGVHVRIARTAGNVVMAHVHADVCGMPGTRWDFRDNCCVIDDSGRSRAEYAAVAVCA